MPNFNITSTDVAFKEEFEISHISENIHCPSPEQNSGYVPVLMHEREAVGRIIAVLQ